MPRLSHSFRAACFVVGACLAFGAAAQGVTPQTVAEGLENPWAVAFLPDGRFLVTERPGRMRVVEADGKIGPPLAGVPPVAASGQGGLLDLVLDSGFAANRAVYFCFSEPGEGGNGTAMARAKLSADGARLEDVKVIFSQKPRVALVATGQMSPSGRPGRALPVAEDRRRSSMATSVPWAPS